MGKSSERVDRDSQGAKTPSRQAGGQYLWSPAELTCAGKAWTEEKVGWTKTRFQWKEIPRANKNERCAKGEAAVQSRFFWSPLVCPIYGRLRISPKSWETMGSYVLLGLGMMLRSSSTNLMCHGNTRTTFTWWKNGSPKTSPPRRSGKPLEGARAFTTWYPILSKNILKSIICIALRVRRGMLEWSWLLCRETLQKLRHKKFFSMVF